MQSLTAFLNHNIIHGIPNIIKMKHSLKNKGNKIINLTNQVQ